jgi:hypothetical protein
MGMARHWQYTGRAADVEQDASAPAAAGKISHGLLKVGWSRAG